MVENQSSHDGKGSVIGADHLTDEDRDQIKQLREIAGIGGGAILTGIIRGETKETPRLLLLEGGVMSLLRFSDPITALHPDRFKTLQTLLKLAERAKKITGIIAIGATKDRVWMRRNYSETTFAHSQNNPTTTQLLDVVRAVMLLHRSGLVHGHLVPENIAPGSTVQIFDAAFTALTPQSEPLPSIAPELLDAFPPTAAADVYGLGIILSRFIEAFPGRDQRFIIEQMLREKPEDRPAMPDIIATLTGKGRTTHVPEHSTAVPARTKSTVLPMVLLAMAVVGGGYWYVTRNDAASFETATLDYASLLRSGQPSLMAKVAQAATIDGNAKAQQATYEVVMAGFDHPSINTKVLRIGFDPRWEASLSTNDRTALLALGFFDLLPQGMLALPPPETLHPAVILAMLGSLDISRGGTQFEKISPAQLGSLPAPMGAAFTALAESGVLTMETGAARALCHIVLGDIRSVVLKTFFDDFQDPTASLLRIRALMPLLNEIRGLEQSMWSELQPGVSGLTGWFAQSDLAKWGEVPIRGKLMLLSGTLPTEKLSIEQYIDLLRFPLTEPRKNALTHLKLNFPFPPESHSSLDVIASPEINVTREQGISIVNAFLIPPKDAEHFFAAWLDTKPDPQAVLALIVARDQSGDEDPFTLNGGRYLSRQDWKASLRDLAKLVTHPEPFIRALAYAKLNPNNPPERSMMERMLPAESNARNRKLLQERLALNEGAKKG